MIIFEKPSVAFASVHLFNFVSSNGKKLVIADDVAKGILEQMDDVKVGDVIKLENDEIDKECGVNYWKN